MTREEAIQRVHFYTNAVNCDYWSCDGNCSACVDAIGMAIEALKAVQGWEELADDLNHKAPTMDVVEVVRCKDCKHAEAQGHWYNCQFHDIYVSKIDYCSRGIRRPV